MDKGNYQTRIRRMNWVDYTDRLGRYLGFPKCCIDEFIERNAPTHNRKLNGSGYIPCTNCDTHLTEQEMIDRINEKRECPDLFPNWKGYGTIELNDKFVGGLN